MSAIGLGCMPLSVRDRPDPDQSVATIHAAAERGITLLDTADAYHEFAGEVGHNEELIRTALGRLGPDRQHLVVATKGGLLRPGDGSWVQDARPEHLAAAARASARRLGVERIDLYQLHRPDPAVPFEDSLGALSELRQEGIIDGIGLSNVTTEQIRTAHRLLGGALVSVQNRFNPEDLSSYPELLLCAELGLAFLPWSPLARPGSGHVESPHELTALATELQVSVYQVILAWELALAEIVIPIPGARRPAPISDSAGPADLDLSPVQVSALTAAFTTGREMPSPIN